MMRLVKKGLMFGNLIPVMSEALVGRYNRALKHLTGKETALTEFHIDISGYSPEIGDEFGDTLYLNPKGCNQQFILLSTDQKTAPLLNSKFSTSRDIIRHFIEENEEELFALTAREAVAGELMNSVFDITAPKDLFNINQIQVEADTIKEHVAGAEALRKKIDTFMRKDDAWWDDVLIADMIEMAKVTGNIQRHPVKLTAQTYAQGNYYTEHFGGIYVFRDVKQKTVIAKHHHEGLSDIPVANVLTFEDRAEIAAFLYNHKLIELIVSDRDDDTAAIIRQKIDFIMIGTAAANGSDLGDMTRQQLRKLEREYASAMPPAYHGLMDIWRWATMNGEYPRIEPDHDGYFYAFRSKQHDDRDLVNMLLAELTPLDFRQLFICHKEAFYVAYQEWSEAKKDYVARFLHEEYVMDKVGARETLFGDEPDMIDPDHVHSEKSAKARVGWKKVQTKDGSEYRVRKRYKKDDDDDDDDDDEIFDREGWRRMRKDMRKRKKKRKR